MDKSDCTSFVSPTFDCLARELKLVGWFHLVFFATVMRATSFVTNSISVALLSHNNSIEVTCSHVDDLIPILDRENVCAVDKVTCQLISDHIRIYIVAQVLTLAE